jgi:putative endonuclease
MPTPEETPGGDTRARKRLGASGERVAAGWLEARGYRIVARNWRCPYGELDLVAEHDGELVFVEVKTRRGQGHGAPEEAVTPVKRRRLIAAAQSYLAEAALEDRPYRIDVVAVDLGPAGAFLGVRHFPHSIGAEE